MTLLDVRDIHQSFGALQILHGISLTADHAEILGIIGPNGAGKSTLFTAISGFLSPSRGEVLLKGKSISGLRPSQVAARGMVRTFQVPQEFGDMTVLDNLRVAGSTPQADSILSSLFGGAAARRAERDLKEKAEHMLERLNLTAVAGNPARALSGGQKKLLELGRALMVAPDVLLIDEPFAGVAPTLRDQLMEHLRQLRQDGLCLLIVEHDIEAIMALSDRVCVLVEGRILIDDTPDQVRRDRRVLDAYLGAAPA
ncbi:MAG: ABC transporter ATP-binding protein [Castellaniella sp.]